MASRSHRSALRLTRFVFRPLVTAIFGYKAEGVENLPARSGALLCANHASFLDPVMLQAPFKRPILYLMDAEFYAVPRMRWFYRLFEAIPVEGPSGNVGALRHAGEALQAGDVVGIFPEGGISRDGRLQPFRPGAAVLAMRHGIALVPAWIEGTFEALPRHARRIRRARVSMRVGKPILVARQESTSLDAGAVARLTERLRAAVGALAPSRDRALE
jgi:1-acyl-sn-glycerol-3-phosphate acyltransferase